MVLKGLFSCLLALLLVSCSNASGDLDSPVEKGTSAKALFTLHCSACHGMDGTKGVSNAANLAESKLTDKKLENVILYGTKNGMMPYKDLLKTESELVLVMDYVKSLRK